MTHIFVIIRIKSYFWFEKQREMNTLGFSPKASGAIGGAVPGLGKMSRRSVALMTAGPAAFTWWGFQSLSKMITVSADWRFRPSPPARVLSRKMKYSEPGSLKVFSSMPRSSAFVVPAGHGRTGLVG